MTNGHDPLADRAAIAATIETGQGAKRITEYTMENGVVLTIKPVPPLILRNAARHVLDPEVPKVFIEDADRTEENPDDPQYIADIEAARERRSMAALTAALLVGTEFKSAPEGVPGPEDDTWIENLKAINEVVGITMEIHDEPGSRARYLDWLRLVAISSETELHILTRILTIGVALTNAEVQAAAESFRRLLARSTDLANSDPTLSLDGDPVPAGDLGAGD